MMYIEPHRLYDPRPLRPAWPAWPALSPVPNTAYVLPNAPRSPEQPERQTKTDTETDTERTPAHDTAQVLVLIAEDEETIAETLALLVEDAGYVALVAHDGREALALSRQHRPHLIITDLMMPYLNGADLISSVRDDAATQGYAAPPILIVTAASRAHAAEAGADAIVSKPFDITKIEAAMQRLLGEQVGG